VGTVAASLRVPKCASNADRVIHSAALVFNCCIALMCRSSRAELPCLANESECWPILSV
jgi:hypothetical protein